ncbi:MAG: ABC transporter permease [Planctomycetota bacterium]|nr:ABC transporter permease [Planctomycetota bacterium]
MIRVAIKMIMGDRLKFFGLLIGLSFASMLITQQAAIFLGYTTRTWAFIDDVPSPDIWVMDPQVLFTEDFKPIADTAVQRVRAVEGVRWAVPMYKNQLPVRLRDGTLQACTVVGVDDATLIGAPPLMVEGAPEHLRQSDGVIVDARASDLSIVDASGVRRALALGDTLSVNDNTARVVGVATLTKAFYWQPVIYTTYSRALAWAPPQRRQLTYVLAKADPGEAIDAVARRIEDTTGLRALTRDEFIRMTASYTLDKTGILINFGITVALGFVIGLLVGGQTFFNYVADNLKTFGALKALGMNNLGLVRMIGAQVVVVGLLGFGIGVGLAAFTGVIFSRIGMGFHLPWQLAVGSAVSVLCICAVAALLAGLRALRVEPGIVFKG